MKTRITQRQLTEKVDRVGQMTGKRLHLSFAASYGGYRLNEMETHTGGASGCFGRSVDCARISAREIDQFLDGIIVGLTWNEQK